MWKHWKNWPCMFVRVYVLILFHRKGSFLLQDAWDVLVGLPSFFFFFFSIRVLFHGHWQLTGQQGKGGDHLLFHSTTSSRSRILRNLFATLHVRWLSSVFNRNACVYQTATRWDLPPYRIIIWVIDWSCNVCLFVYLMNWY